MMSASNCLATSVTLPVSGRKFPNRLFKSAMTEWLADPATLLPNEKHFKLYQRWSEGQCGVLVTGNVMVCRDYCEAPANVALEAKDAEPARLQLYKQWADATKKHGAVALMQLSHSGRQTPMSVSWQPVAPSAVPLNFKGMPPPIAPVCRPRALTAEEIALVKEQFVTSSMLAERAGFDGVQLHSAHGYLLSEFLSPLVNRRSDSYGGTLDNRQRLLLEILREIRQSCGKNFIVGVKLNSSDFDKGGFNESDSMQVIQQLKTNGIDFVEISGGTYECAEMMKKASNNTADENTWNSTAPVRESTARREAFFIDFATKARAAFPEVVFVVTGGWRRGHVMNAAIQNGEVDMIGLGRPLCVDPDFPKRLLAADYSSSAVSVTIPFYSLELNVGIADTSKQLSSMCENFWHQVQMLEIVNGRKPQLNLWSNYFVRAACIASYVLSGYIWQPKRNRLTSSIAITLLASSALAVAVYSFGW